MRPQSNEPYGFSITYTESVEHIMTMLTGYKQVPKHNSEGEPLPGEFDEILVPNAYPLLTKEGGRRVRAIFEMSMDKFNPLGKFNDYDCAVAAAEVETRLASTITISANQYLYGYEDDPSRRLLDWDSFLKALTHSLYRFATLARDGHFTNFAKAIMTESIQPHLQEQQSPGILRQLFKRPRSMSNREGTDMYDNY